MNDTNNPELTSWVASANGSDFPIQNLPFGVFSPPVAGESQRVGVAIGAMIFDVAAGVERELFDDGSRNAAEACARSTLNPLMSMGREHHMALRNRLSESWMRSTRDETERRRRHMKRMMVLSPLLYIMLPHDPNR